MPLDECARYISSHEQKANKHVRAATVLNIKAVVAFFVGKGESPVGLGSSRSTHLAFQTSEASVEYNLDGGRMRPKHQIFGMKFANVYPLYIQKAERKNRTKQEVDQIIRWLTGYNQAGLQKQIEQGHDFETFFAQAPAMNPNRSLIKGVVCGMRVEEIEDPLMQKIRYLDKLIDELAKGKALEKILRQ
jgi:hypothetical protein